MTNIPYEERIKNRDNDWYYNKCIRQYHFIIKAEGANQRYKEEIARLNKIIDELEKYLIFKKDNAYKLENPKKSKLKPYGIEKDMYHISYCRYYEILDKLIELKEEGKE